MDNDLISRAEVKKIFQNAPWSFGPDKALALELIDKVPTVNTEEVKE